MKKILFIILFLPPLLSYGGKNVDVWVYVDSLQVFSAEHVFRHFPEKFKAYEETNINFGISGHDYWIVLDIKNSSDKTLNQKCVIDYGLLQKVSFYETNGFAVSEIEKELSTHAYLFPIKVGPFSKKQYIIHVEGKEIPVILPIRVGDSEEIFKLELLHTFLFGGFYGILLVTLLLTIVINLLSNGVIFRYLLIYLLGTIIYFTLIDGFLYRYDIIKSVILQYKMVMILPMVLLPILEQFIKRYYNSSIYYRRSVSTGLHLMSSVTIVLIVSGLMQMSTLFYISAIYVILALLVILYPLMYLYKDNKRSIVIMCFSVGFLLIGFSVDLLLRIGIIPISTFSLIALKLGFLLQIGTFLFGTYDKFQTLKNKTALFNKKLGDLVMEKTAEVNQQNEELITQTEQLEIQKEELQSQKEELQTQKEILEAQNVKLERLSLAASSTENVIYIFDINGELLWFNESFSSQLGMSFDQYQGHEKIKINQISSYEKINQALEEVIADKKPVTYEASMTISDKKRWFQTTLTPVRDNGDIKYVVAIDSEITRLKEYEEQLDNQRKEFEDQRNLAITRRKEVEDQQREITDSLNYAQRIQAAILPSPSSISRFFPDSFVLFIPRDIVSGDFYWFHRIDDKYIYIVVDCTGHGVPGAFMSIIGTYLLNNIIIQNNETRPAEILKQLNRKLKISLKNTAGSKTNDGMDVALTVVDKSAGKLYFSGSLRPLYLFQDGKFFEQKGDKNPITSAISGNTMATYNQYEFDIKPGDRFYMFSDGITDQFGGKSNKKFLSKRLKQVLFDSQMYNMNEQKKIIQKAVIDWRGSKPQIDDILLVGVKI